MYTEVHDHKINIQIELIMYCLNSIILTKVLYFLQLRAQYGNVLNLIYAFNLKPGGLVA